MNCEEKGRYCDNQDVKLCQMKSHRQGTMKANVYKGKIIAMCAECRKSQNGQFKFYNP